MTLSNTLSHVLGPCEYCSVEHTDEPCALCGHVHLHQRCKATNAAGERVCSCCCYLTAQQLASEQEAWQRWAEDHG